MSKNKLEKKYFGKFKKPLIELPNLVQDQLNSYKWLMEEGIKEVLKEFSPIRDYSEKKFELDFKSFEIGKPEHDEFYAKENKLSYDAPIKAKVKLINKTTGSEKEQDIFENSEETKCYRCGKNLKVGKVIVAGWKEKEEIECQVCGAIIDTFTGFAGGSHVVKKI